MQCNMTRKLERVLSYFGCNPLIDWRIDVLQFVAAENRAELLFMNEMGCFRETDVC